MEPAGTAWSRVLHAVRGPRLQVLNLLVFYVVVLVTVNYPNPPWLVALSVAWAAALDLGLTRWLWGSWRAPFGSIIATMGIWLLLDAYGTLPFLLLPILLVGSKHLIRYRGSNLFNANNLAACLLILGQLVRVGVHEWGAAQQTVAMMLLFGTVATLRAHRFRLAVAYLLFSYAVYGALAVVRGYSWETPFLMAFNPPNVMIGFFAVTDPATSPSGMRAQFAWASLIVLIAVPSTLAGRPDAAVFALLVAAPQRHLVVAGLDSLGMMRRRRALPATEATA